MFVSCLGLAYIFSVTCSEFECKACVSVSFTMKLLTQRMMQIFYAMGSCVFIFPRRKELHFEF